MLKDMFVNLSKGVKILIGLAPGGHHILNCNLSKKLAHLMTVDLKLYHLYDFNPTD